MVRDPAGLDWPAVKARSTHGLGVAQIVTGELFGADGLCLVTADDDLYRRTVERLQAILTWRPTWARWSTSDARGAGWTALRRGRTTLGAAVERLREVVVYAAERGVRIALEPINRYETDFIHSAADGMRMIDDLGYDNLGLMLDMFHMNIEDAIHRGRPAAGRRPAVARAHRRLEPSLSRQRAPRFHAIFDALREMGYQGYVSAEFLPLPDPDTAAEHTIVVPGSSWLRRSRPKGGEKKSIVVTKLSGSFM